ncbi:carbohydrate ABC transporter permease [Paenibacillus xerothermodurans]|uniref:Carbohydrate ABC transporter permease n=2 Tax=Paenibacillus xerothermodurans TaxID=1977292 RepID=A0A2W1NC72_PAEXE|nr:carbohydrate ABC transporter permease [Paenibacillus xerothermodurans]PZE20651.1 carbohydrate ABC transporter permease [Paenibacillus xerothermodurans]
MIIPFFWMISSSLKSLNEMYAFPPVWIPGRLLWENYIYMFNSAPWGKFLLNTTKITLLVVVGQLLTCSMGAYAFARLKFPGRDALFTVYLATMMIPYQVTMIPTFKIIKSLGWLNTHNALIVPALFSAFGTFLLRQFFLTLPKELEQSAMIDGCSFPQIYRHIMLPNAKPALVTLAIFIFMGTWNDFLGPLIYINKLELKTLTLGLATFQGTYTTQWNYMMAGAVIVTLPVLLVYFLAQRHFVEGVVMSGIKE